MPQLIEAPKVLTAAGNKPKRIEEFAGRISSGHDRVSVARMVSPGGWIEPAQQPEFDEITVVLRGTLRVETNGDVLEVHGGQAVIVRAGEGVRYSTPGADGAEYIAVCLPAFSPQTVHRCEEETHPNGAKAAETFGFTGNSPAQRRGQRPPVAPNPRRRAP